jgi:hypothetical protein
MRPEKGQETRFPGSVLEELIGLVHKISVSFQIAGFLDGTRVLLPAFSLV